MRKKQLVSDLMLLIAAIIWGLAFVAQRQGMEFVGPFTFNGARFLMGSITLLPVIFIMNRPGKAGDEAIEDGAKALSPAEAEAAKKAERKNLLIAGIACGSVLFCAASFQQLGINLGSTAGKSAFITALYMVIVPIFGLFLHKKVLLPVWGCVVLAVVGLYLLCIQTGLNIDKGDFVVFIGSFFWATHILTIDHFVAKTDGVKLSCTQFFVCSILCWIVAFITENPNIAGLVDAAVPLLYAGILSAGVAYTFQVLGQKNADPTIASMILSTESVFGVVGGTLFLHEVMNGREIFGCILMFIAVMLAQLPWERIMSKDKTARL